MDEHQHGHDHDHDHAHDQGPILDNMGLSGELADTSSRSLADALRWSFVILSIIMVLVLVGFLLTGFKEINAQEIGIKKVFGRFDGTAEPGLAYTWPFPIGKIDVVSTALQGLVVDDFWLNETPEMKAQKLSEKQTSGNGLQPGWDGAVLTGDRNLLHVQLVCSYAVKDALAYKQNVPDKYARVDPMTHQEQTVNPTENIIRSAVANAVIHVGAEMTGDRIQNNQGEFLSRVKLAAQTKLDQLPSGIRIDNITFTKQGITWPLAARPAYERAQSALQQRNAMISTALSEADSDLRATAGGSYAALVGELTSSGRFREAMATTGPAEDAAAYNLIGQYNKAVEENRKAQAETILQKIDEVLVSNNTGGKAAGAIATARTRENAIKQSLAARAARFNDLKDEFARNRQFMLNREWAQVYEEIFNNPTAIKTFLNSEGGKTVLLLNQDQQILAQVREWMAKNPPQRSQDEKNPPGPSR